MGSMLMFDNSRNIPLLSGNQQAKSSSGNSSNIQRKNHSEQKEKQHFHYLDKRHSLLQHTLNNYYNMFSKSNNLYSNNCIVFSQQGRVDREQYIDQQGTYRHKLFELSIYKIYFYIKNIAYFLVLCIEYNDNRITYINWYHSYNLQLLKHHHLYHLYKFNLQLQSVVNIAHN